MHRGFLIDLENVQSAGVEGVEQLTAEDAVLIFYSNKADNLKIDTVKAIHESKAAVEYIKVFNGTPNALDFQLITYLFLHYDESDKDSQYWIISKDTGYDAVIKMCKRQDVSNVKRAPAIKNAIHYKMKVDTIEALKARRRDDRRKNDLPDEDLTEEEEDGLEETLTEAEESGEEEPFEAETENTAAQELFDADQDESEHAEESESENADSEAEDSFAPEEEESGAEEEPVEAGSDETAAEEPSETGEEAAAEESAEAEEATEPLTGEVESQDGTADEIAEETARETDAAEAEEEAEKEEEPENEEKRARVREYLHSVCGIDADEKVLDVVIQGLSQFAKRGQFYQFFRRNLGGKKGGELYRKTKEHIMEMHREFAGEAEA